MCTDTGEATSDSAKMSKMFCKTIVVSSTILIIGFSVKLNLAVMGLSSLCSKRLTDI